MRGRRQPELTDPPAALAKVASSAEDYRLAAERAADARTRLMDALAAARAAGASYSLIGRLAGLSRQSVTQAISERRCAGPTHGGVFAFSPDG